MAYEKTNWTNETPINTDNLNKIEDGIENNDKALGNKQEKLTAGENITIEDGVISASGGEVDFLTKLYSANSFASTGKLSEKITNFYGVLIVAHESTYNYRGSVFLPTELAVSTNIPVPVYSIVVGDVGMRGAKVIIGSGGSDLTMEQINSTSYIKAIYGVFRK